MDDRPSFRRRRDVLRLIGAVAAPWLLFGVALGPALILRMAYLTGHEIDAPDGLMMVWFLLFGFPAILSAPAFWVLGVVRLVRFRSYRRSLYGWLWPFLMHANAIALLLSTGH